MNFKLLTVFLSIIMCVEVIGEHNQQSCQCGRKEYQHDESLKDAKDCNACICNNGVVVCTSKMCNAKPDESYPVETKDCTYGGKNYRNGVSFPDLDGCNTCKCTNGSVECTKITCKAIPDKSNSTEEKKVCSFEGQIYKDGNSIPRPGPDSCNVCTCKNGDIACIYVACQAATPTQ